MSQAKISPTSLLKWIVDALNQYVRECTEGEPRELKEYSVSQDTEAYEVVQFFRENQERRSVMNRFWDMVANSTLVQGFITLATVLTTCYLWATGQPVPQELWTADGIILGFFFGAKTQQIVSRGR